MLRDDDRGLGAHGRRDGSAWTWHGRPIPQDTVPLDHIDGPVLAIAGAQDRLWDSEKSVRQIMTELDQDHDRFPHQALVYPAAGHQVGTFPYLPDAVRTWNPLAQAFLENGGTRAADAAAQEQGWPRLLAFLAAMGG